MLKYFLTHAHIVFEGAKKCCEKDGHHISDQEIDLLTTHKNLGVNPTFRSGEEPIKCHQRMQKRSSSSIGCEGKNAVSTGIWGIPGASGGVPHYSGVR